MTQLVHGLSNLSCIVVACMEQSRVVPWLNQFRSRIVSLRPHHRPEVGRSLSYRYLSGLS